MNASGSPSVKTIPGPDNCRIQGLDPEMYLTEVIKRLPHNATVEQAAELTPARFAAALRAREQAVA